MILSDESLIVFIFTICTILILWLVFYYRRLQQALYWLHGRQHIKMRDRGEIIRERILQDLFIYRRNLELSKATSRDSQLKLEKHDLETFENIHHSLKRLSEYLYPAHIDDSLSLAIMCLLESWKLHIPGLNLQLNLSNECHEQSYERSRLILMVLDELLQITLPLISPLVSISATLQQQGHQNQLIVELNSPDIFKLESYSCLEKLNFIKQTFNFLISGKCFYRKENSNQ
ncbi:MAG: hypothetical protein WBA41_27915, partial [Rivularia sp. (in: cyanobacteria)]